MLRKIPGAFIRRSPSGYCLEHPSKKGSAAYLAFFATPPGEGAQHTPFPLAESGGLAYWAYRSEYYVTEERDLDAEDVRALLNERENRKRLKLQRARDLQAMVDATPATQPRRERIPGDVQSQVWRRDGGLCVVCGSNASLEFDHIVPVSRGGANTVRNLQLLCETCNRRKGATIGGEDLPRAGTPSRTTGIGSHATSAPSDDPLRCPQCNAPAYQLHGFELRCVPCDLNWTKAA